MLILVLNCIDLHSYDHLKKKYSLINTLIHVAALKSSLKTVKFVLLNVFIALNTLRM